MRIASFALMTPIPLTSCATPSTPARAEAARQGGSDGPRIGACGFDVAGANGTWPRTTEIW